MKLLLTSGGITNPSLHQALVDLLGKPVDEASALCVPTAAYAFPEGAAIAWRVISGSAKTPLCGLGWKSLGVLELTALPSIDEQNWLPAVESADALLVGGGDVLYLCDWMRRSGLADRLPSLLERTVYVGVSSGSMVLTPTPRKVFTTYFLTYGGLHPHADDGRVLGLVDFSLLVHMDGANPENSPANLESVAATISLPTYAIDDETAIKVAGDSVEVVSEGRWKLFTP